MDDNFRADMHCHSTCSDGTVAPVELVHLAKSIGLQGLSITDHDTISAYETAIPAAKEAGIQLLTGVEFSSSHKGCGVHILAYCFKEGDPGILEFCQVHTLRREERNLQIIHKINEMGYDLSVEETRIGSQKGGSWGRPHIAEALVKRGYVSTIKEAFKKFLGNRAPAFFPGKEVTVEETLEVIKQANALAVIAHPMLIFSKAIAKDMLTMDFDGIEGYYSRWNAKEEDEWRKRAQERDWLITGGSDFHGTVKPEVKLGSSWVDAERFQVFYEHYQRNLL
jgi:predicted metal-dependent phosphoesterase TrpH